jgi:hypothetical protein
MSSIYPSPPTSPTCLSVETRKQSGEAPALPASETFALPTAETSPLQCSSTPASEVEEEAENGDRLTVLAITSYLNLTEGRCGGTTQQNKPCRNRIRKDRRERIISSIESIVALPRSSPELKTELHQLVALIHCYKHDVGRPVDARVEALMENLFGELGDTVSTMSAEKRIRKALRLVTTACSWTTEADGCCKQIIGGQKVTNCSKTINEIVKPEVNSDDAELQYFLEVLAVNMLCHDHSDSQNFSKVASWKSVIMEIRAKIDQESVQDVEGSLHEKPKSRTLLSNVQVIEKQSSEKKASSLRDPASHWPKAYDITTFNTVRWDRVSKDNSPYLLIRKTIQRALDVKDLRDGHIYLYEVEGNQGYVKVGYTTRSVQQRHSEWEFECNRQPKSLYPTLDGSAIAIPNVRRVEALCHAELDKYRIKMYCKWCMKQHIEWFKISPAEAIVVIQKWTAWARTRPYQSTELRSIVKWTLTEEKRQEVQDIALFMKRLSGVVN